MRLMEIINNQVPLKQAIAVVHQYTNNGRGHPQLSDMVHQLLASNDTFKYSGIMYRTIYLPTPLLQQHNPQSLLQYITRYDVTAVTAWAKTKQGMKYAVYHEIDSGNVEYNGAVTISRRGDALDINRLGKRDEFFEREGEVLSTSHDGTKMVGYGVGVDLCAYNPGQYAEFIQALIQADEEDMD